jgi:hypothetical protein
MDGRPKSKAEAAEEQAENNRKKWIDIGTVVGALLAALFTGVLVIVGLCGVRAANRTLLAIEKQVILMRKQENLMRDTAQRQLRAYIGVSAASMSRDEHSGVPQAQVDFKNFGQTPAHDVTGWIDIVFDEYPLKGILPVPDRINHGVDVLGPGQITILAPPQKPPLPRASIGLLGSPKLTCYVYGEIRYKDVFGHEWTTQVRLLYGGVAATRHSPTGQWLLSPDVEGNKAT